MNVDTYRHSGWLIPSPYSSDAGMLRVDVGLLKTAVLTSAADLLRQIYVKQVKATTSPDGDYVQPDGYQLPAGGSHGALRAAIGTQALALRGAGTDLEDLADELDGRAGVIADGPADAAWLFDAFVEFLGAIPDRYVRFARSERSLCRVAFADGQLLVAVREPEVRELATAVAEPSGMSIPEFLGAVARVRHARRAAGSPLTAEELLSLQLAYGYLEQGFRAPLAYMTWGQPGFRRHQTLMSVTDPGEGHLDGTTVSNSNLDGVIVHVEHLERGVNESRHAVEAYRIPYLHTLAKVRINVGDDAPCSSYVGRPVFEGTPRQGMLKAVNTLAAACSAILMEGLTECKLAIEGMTASEAIDFMRAMAVAVRRDRRTQVLAAAFNLNTAILDDRPSTLRASGGVPRLVSDRLEIGLLGIELADSGGFDKVTWDGAGDSYPSRCVLEQISFADAVTLVHRAHERGLLTYFSAGFRLSHLPLAVFTGVDGVGVGGAQILRYMDKGTGNHGPFIDENISEILDIRDRAEMSVRGQATALLARLDRMRFETTITVADDWRRQALFEAICQAQDADDESLRSLLTELDHIRAAEPGSEHPTLDWMTRLESAGSASLAAQSLSAVEWRGQMRHLQRLADGGDLLALGDELSALRLRVEGRVSHLCLPLPELSNPTLDVLDVEHAA